jgi:DNA-directed RNA polymerase specialized sigma24 family protein
MRHGLDSYLFSGAFAPVLSLEELSSRLDPETGNATFDIPDDAPLPDARLAHVQAHTAVQRFVDALPARDREIVRRVFWEDDTQTAIAADLGVSKMAISKAIARIARQGRVVLADHEHLALLN